jgi:hypothetical protein
MRAFRKILSLICALMILAMGYTHAVAGEIEDSATAWKRWKNIDAAIALRPLDGPGDIIEKAEIIDDRTDELSSEKIRLNKEIDFQQKKLVNLRNQREVLQDLADIQMGGDSQTRQRLQDLAERIRRGEILLKLYRESILELENEFARMKKLAAMYREKARLLRLKEGGAQ